MLAMIGALALFLLAVFSVARKGICTLLALLAIVHVLIADYLFVFDGRIYYLSAAIASGIGVLVVMNRYSYTKFTIHIMAILGCQIVVNGAGWVAFEAGYPPDFYNAVSGAFYIVLIIRLLSWTKMDGREHSDSRHSAGIYKHNSVGVSHYMEIRK